VNTTIESIKFKRGDKETLELKLVGDNKPLEGEPIFELDTNKLKIGNGINDYVDLPYIGNGTGPEPEDTDILLRGYFKEADGKFYPTPTSVDPLPKLRSKLYLDILTNRLFTYVVEAGQSILDGHFITCVTYATSDKAGIIKLYDDLGDNEDGTMTQKAITDSIDTIDFDVAGDDCLVLKKPRKRTTKKS